MHLLGNMWFLWLFGNNIEDSMGRGRVSSCSTCCAASAAALAQVMADPDSVVPMVGASGRDQRRDGRVSRAVPARARVSRWCRSASSSPSIALPAWVMLLLLGRCCRSSAGSRAVGGEGGGVAFWAHVGGFVAGVVLIKLFARRDYVAQHRAAHWRPRSI